MRTPSSSTWRAWWKVSRSHSWRSEPGRHALAGAVGALLPGEGGGPAPEPTDPPHLSHNCCYTTVLGAGQGVQPHSLLVSASSPSASSCSGAEARAPREGTLRLSDFYLLTTFSWSPGPGPPGLCRSLLAPGDAIKSLQGPPRQPIHLEEPEQIWSHLSHLSTSPEWLDQRSLILLSSGCSGQRWGKKWGSPGWSTLQVDQGRSSC